MADALARLRARQSRRGAPWGATTRTCDGCDLCCTAPGIKELGKPPGVPCQHLAGEAGRSCSVYADRPMVCARFLCLWRATDAVLPEWLRPASCGFLLAFNDVHVWPGVVCVHPDPARPDAWRTMWAQTVLVTLAEKWNCLVAIRQAPDTSHIICPNGKMIDLTTLPPDRRAMLVRPDGFIGAPEHVFGWDRRPLIERIRETKFEWDLPPPP